MGQAKKFKFLELVTFTVETTFQQKKFGTGESLMQFSIVQFQEVKSRGFRLDAEYWHPEFIKNSALVSPKIKIKDVVAPNIANIKSSPVKRSFDYLEISNISTTSCEYHTVHVTPEDKPHRAHYILNEKDIVVSTVRPNRNAVAFIEEDGIIGSSGLAVLRAKDIEPEYLFAFCKTDYFIKCLVRANKASMYPAVAINDVLDTPLLFPSKEFMEIITGIIQDALLCVHVARQIYQETQDFLVSHIQIAEYQPINKLCFEKDFSDISQAGRMDAEYFQPKYDELVAAIKDYAGGWNTLKNLVSLKGADFKPESKLEYKYIELANIADYGVVTGCMIEQGKDLPTRARRVVSTGDVIVSSIEGSLSSIALIGEEHDQSLCSTGFHVVNSTALNSETLLVFLKSIAGQLQLKKGCSGTILTAINKDEFGNIVIPIVAERAQTEIKKSVTESFDLRQMSQKLLELAKRAVQTAIEQGEQTALEWLESEE